MSLISFDQMLLALAGLIVFCAGLLVIRYQRGKAETETPETS